MRAAAIIIIVITIGFLAYFGQLPIRQWLHWSSPDVQRIRNLQLENESLKGQLLESKLKQTKNVSNADSDRYFSAKIYSTYPFNDRHRFTISAGKQNGLTVGMLVLADKNLLLGKIIKVFDTYSEVQSIFSPDWQQPVKIGEQGIDGLLTGGTDPIISMIIGDKPITSGQPIYTASKEFPYGLKVGEIKDVTTGASSFFKEAKLTLPYDFNVLLEVLIDRNYE